MQLASQKNKNPRAAARDNNFSIATAMDLIVQNNEPNNVAEFRKKIQPVLPKKCLKGLDVPLISGQTKNNPYI